MTALISKLKSMTLVSTSYILQFQRYCLDKILKVKITTARLKVKSRSHHDIAHLQPSTNVRPKYQLPTTYGCRDIAQTRFYRSRSLRQGPRSNQGHTMRLHTYNPQSMSLPSNNFLHFTVLRYSPDKIL